MSTNGTRRESGARTSFRWSSSSLSVPGNVRKVNEDSVLDLPASGVWVVADGMGGHNAGDVASRMIVETLSEVRPAERPSQFVDEIEDRVRRVNRTLYEGSLTAGGGLCGSTIVVLAAFANFAACLWAGDSRVYRLREGKLDQMTRDHSELEELVDQGREAEATAASNVITRAVGGTEDVSLDFELCELADGDQFLLCSDGLYRELTDQDIAAHLARPPADACQAMIEQSLRGTCADNVSVITVRFTRPAGATDR